MSLLLRVLLVEDRLEDCELLLRALKRAGFAPEWHRVDTKEDYLAALAENWDIILSDYSLPQFNGLEALKLAKDHQIEAPFIIVSGTIGEETAVEAIKLGAADYLIKDRLGRLGPSVNQALEQVRLMREGKEAAEMLRLRERALAEVSQGVLICDEKRHIIYANESFQQMTGYPEKEVLGRKCALLQGQDTDQNVIVQIRAALNAGQPFEGEILNYRRNGKPFWNELSITPIRGEKGAPVRFVGILRDITARKLAQQALGESEQRVRQERALLRALIDSIPDLIFFKDQNSIFLGCNKAFEKHIGITEELLVGLSDYEIVPRGSADDYRRKDQELIESGEPQKVEEWIPFKGGGGGTFETVKTPYYGPHGESLGLIGVSRDITERRNAEERMRLVHDRLQIAVQASQAGIWELDIANNDVHWDDQMFALYGMPPTSSRGGIERWFRAMPAEDVARCTSIFDEIQTKGRNSFDIEFRITRANDNTQRIMRSMGIVRRDETGKAVRITGTNRDVTQERQRERELAIALIHEKELSEKARAGDRAKSEFLAVMSHEVRTPMNGILGFAELLAQAPNIHPEHRDYSRIILQSGEALLRILDDILDFSRLEAGRLQVQSTNFSPRKLLEDIRGLLAQKSADKSLELTVNIAPGVPEIFDGDVGRLRQVLLNLVGNAIKFTERGSITISLSPVPGPGSRFEFSVKDTGEGIEATQLESIFQPFTQADSSISRRHGGTGLGLTISRRLTELMGGELTVRSKPGEGSEFLVTVPFRIVQEAAAVDHAPEEPLDATFAERHPMKILIVEDDWVNLKLIQNVVRRLGYDASAAQNGSEAVDMYKRDPADCILMDLQMPEMDGIEATENIRRHEKQSPGLAPTFISALTANIFPADRQRCFDVGMNGYLNKPVKIAALAEMLRKASTWRGQAARKA